VVSAGSVQEVERGAVQVQSAGVVVKRTQQQKSSERKSESGYGGRYENQDREVEEERVGVSE